MTEKNYAYGVCVYKETKKSFEFLLCKSSLSRLKWGFLKGTAQKNENSMETALREFYEESSIKIKNDIFEEYFLQENKNKDIGIYLVNAKNINNIEKYFYENKLKKQYISKENEKVEFFDIKSLPNIKTKQHKIVNNILKLSIFRTHK